jgi:hypothetical protein
MVKASFNWLYPWLYGEDILLGFSVPETPENSTNTLTL